MNSFYQAAGNLSNLSIDWTLENLLGVSNGEKSNEELFHAYENPDEMIADIQHAYRLYLVIIHYGGRFLKEGPGNLVPRLDLILEIIGMINGVDFVFDGDHAFIRINDLSKIYDLFLKFHNKNYPGLPCNGELEKIEQSLRGRDVETYNSYKERNKNNQLERLSKEAERKSKKELTTCTEVVSTKSERGMLIIRIGDRSKFIISKNIENKLDSIIDELDEFSITSFPKLPDLIDDSDVIIIQSVDKKDILKAMNLYK